MTILVVNYFCFQRRPGSKQNKNKEKEKSVKDRRERRGNDSDNRYSVDGVPLEEISRFKYLFFP